ncbi:MAG: hypothetical protein J6Y29_03815 [Clostridiales bacterium]|nr:hypothetical protein [Clostridiales bacterium]
MDDLIAKIKEYLHIINPSITIEGNDLLDFVIGEVIDRVQLYLNSDTIPTRLERILANIVNTGFTKASTSKDNNGEVDQVITSISDNGQSISYSNEVKQYFATATDDELFSGFAGLLSRYRRIKVVYPKDNDGQDS